MTAASNATADYGSRHRLWRLRHGAARKAGFFRNFQAFSAIACDGTMNATAGKVL
jgi:hypothetical protein